MSVSRPSGVTILAILLIIAAPLLIIVGTILVIASLPSAYNVQALYYWFISKVGTSLELGLGVAISEAQNNVNIWYYLLVGFIIYAGLCFPAGIGLLYMKNWGRYLALVVSIASIIAGVITIFRLVGLIPLAFGIGMLVYLISDVKYEFQ